MDTNSYDSRLMFNLDETSVNIVDHYQSKLLEHSANPSVPILPKAERYASTTLVICSSSYGSALTSTIIWPQSTVPADLVDLRGYNIAIIANSSGWQTKVSFEQMMMEIYLPQMVQRRKDLSLTEKEVLLILDGHNSRMSLLFIYACIRWRITVLIIPAHTSSEIQPNDCGINGAFKTKFTSECAKRSILDTKPSIPPQNTQQNEQIVLPKNLPSPTHYPYARLPKHEILKALNAADVDIPLPSLFDNYKFDGKSSKAERQRAILVQVIPRALEKALSIATMECAWKKAGLLPLKTGKESVLSQLPEGTVIASPKRSVPTISGRILTSQQMLAEMWEWETKKHGDIKTEEYIQQTLKSIYDIITQTEDQYQSLFAGRKAITEADIAQESQIQFLAVQDLRQRRIEAEQQQKAQTASHKNLKSLESSNGSEERKDVIILGQPFSFSEFRLIREMSSEQFNTFIESLQSPQEQITSEKTLQTEQRTQYRRRRKRPRTEITELEQPPVLKETSSSSEDSSKTSRRYATRQKHLRTDTPEFYDDSEMDILLDS